MDKRTKVQLQPVRSIFKLYPYLVLTIIEVNIMNCRQKKNKPSKIVPSNIKDLLTPIGLAYWIMDDGDIQKKGLYLNTYGFTPEDTLCLKITLENIFGRKFNEMFYT